jgi:hypothetical protein
MSLRTWYNGLMSFLRRLFSIIADGSAVHGEFRKGVYITELTKRRLDKEIEQCHYFEKRKKTVKGKKLR